MSTLTAPYKHGDKVRFLVQLGGLGTCLVNGEVVDVQPTDRGTFRVDTTYPLATSPDGLGRGRFYVAASGHSDYLSLGHNDTCLDCGAGVSIQEGTARWRGTRDELVCRTGCAALSAA